MNASSDGIRMKHRTRPMIPRISDASASPDLRGGLSPPDAQPGGEGGGGALGPGVAPDGGPGLAPGGGGGVDDGNDGGGGGTSTSRRYSVQGAPSGITQAMPRP